MKKYVRTRENIDSKIKDEIVMVNVTQGNYYALNPVASKIWELIESPKSVSEICAILVDEYDIDLKTCQNEVESFISQLLKFEVIKELHD